MSTTRRAAVAALAAATLGASGCFPAAQTGRWQTTRQVASVAALCDEELAEPKDALRAWRRLESGIPVAADPECIARYHDANVRTVRSEYAGGAKPIVYDSVAHTARHPYLPAHASREAAVIVRAAPGWTLERVAVVPSAPRSAGPYVPQAGFPGSLAPAQELARPTGQTSMTIPTERRTEQYLVRWRGPQDEHIWTLHGRVTTPTHLREQRSYRNWYRP
jgi:hypothetical protein